MDKTKLPLNYGKNALQFDGSEPEGLERYLETIEDVFDTAKASSDEDKKWIALRYYILETAKEIVEDEAVSFYNTETRPDAPKKAQGKTAVMLNESAGIKPGFAQSIEDKLQAIEATMVANMDKMIVADKQRWQEFETALQKMQQGKKPTPETTPQSWDNPNRPTSSNMRPVTSRDCFYCGIFGHFIGDCLKRKDDIDKGLIKVIDGRTLFFDGRPIPQEPKNKPQSQKAAEYRARQTMNSNLLAYDFVGQYSLGEPNTPEYDSKEDEIRTLRVERQNLRVALLQKQNEVDHQGSAAASSSSSEPEEIQINPLAKMAEFMITHWDANNQHSRKEASSRKVAGRKKPPESQSKTPKPPVLAKKPEKAGPVGPEKVRVEPEKAKPRPKVTIEEVENSDNESSEEEAELAPKKKVAFELPYQKVVPIQHVPPPKTAPRKPVERLETAKSSGKNKSYALRSDLDEMTSTKETLNQIMETRVKVPIKRLLGNSPGLQRDFRLTTTKTRRPYSRQELGDVLLAEIAENSESAGSENDPRGDDLPYPVTLELEVVLAEDAIELSELPFDQYVQILTQQIGDMPEGAIIMGDPVLQYLESLSPGEVPKQVYTAMTSAALRCVYPIVNGEGVVESITDGGSQIVSMSSEEATNQGVPYDPSIQILMQSANGQVEKTLGLARNIPFGFGPLTVYLQVHVIRVAPYKVLLGRPFEILTESVVRNSKDGSQTITMTDPNSGARVTIPTRPRGFYKQIQPPRNTETELPAESKPDF
ncbi:hypothetical protein FB451DRAFT_1421730 [Mycena latifolia]|nr:hypothetical protein FB451DRAFT_1421730 [Mycena latifolia]